MYRKYILLRVIAAIMEILGIVVGIITLIAACGLIRAGVSLGSEIDKWTAITGQNQGAFGAITGLAGGLLVSILPIFLGGSIALILFVGGAMIVVQIDIETNTRKLNWNLTQYTSQRPSTFHEDQQPQDDISDGSADSLHEANTNYCPMCGASVTNTEQNCPQCNYKLS